MPKKIRNAFYFFMKDLQQEEERKGRTIPISSMQNLASPKWQNLSEAEKAPYAERARQYKKGASRGGKLASDGTSVEDNLRERDDIQRNENRMISDIQQYLTVFGQTDDAKLKSYLRQKMIYFVSFNILCRTENEYIPNEVGIVEYSIDLGINKIYHTLIFPGFPPTGFAGEAKRLSGDKHHINIFEPEQGSETNMAVVFRNITEFINPQDEDILPPVFCLEDDMQQTKGCLDWLATRARSREEFRVWNAKYLLLELRAASGHPLPFVSTAEDLLTKTCYDYDGKARCDFHDVEKNETYNCALLYAKKMGYLISDAVCGLYGVQLTDHHLPNQFSGTGTYTVHKGPQSSVVRVPLRVSEPDAPTPSRPAQQNRYLQNNVEDDDEYAGAASAPAAQPILCQPPVDCVAAQMARLGVNLARNTATEARPGLGIGRGQKRVN